MSFPVELDHSDHHCNFLDVFFIETFPNKNQSALESFQLIYILFFWNIPCLCCSNNNWGILSNLQLASDQTYSNVRKVNRVWLLQGHKDQILKESDRLYRKGMSILLFHNNITINIIG